MDKERLWHLARIHEFTECRWGKKRTGWKNDFEFDVSDVIKLSLKIFRGKSNICKGQKFWNFSVHNFLCFQTPPLQCS